MILIKNISDLNECESSPCVNGECVDKFLGYECNCERGWNDVYCDQGKL